MENRYLVRVDRQLPLRIYYERIPECFYTLKTFSLSLSLHVYQLFFDHSISEFLIKHMDMAWLEENGNENHLGTPQKLLAGQNQRPNQIIETCQFLFPYRNGAWK